MATLIEGSPSPTPLANSRFFSNSSPPSPYTQSRNNSGPRRTKQSVRIVLPANSSARTISGKEKCHGNGNGYPVIGNNLEDHTLQSLEMKTYNTVNGSQLNPYNSKLPNGNHPDEDCMIKAESRFGNNYIPGHNLAKTFDHNYMKNLQN